MLDIAWRRGRSLAWFDSCSGKTKGSRRSTFWRRREILWHHVRVTWRVDLFVVLPGHLVSLECCVDVNFIVPPLAWHCVSSILFFPVLLGVDDLDAGCYDQKLLLGGHKAERMEPRFHEMKINEQVIVDYLILEDESAVRLHNLSTLFRRQEQALTFTNVLGPDLLTTSDIGQYRGRCQELNSMTQ